MAVMLIGEVTATTAMMTPVITVVGAERADPSRLGHLLGGLCQDDGVAHAPDICAALAMKPELILVASIQAPDAERELLEASAKHAVSSLFISDLDDRTVGLLRSGANDVVGTEVSPAELRSRLDRILAGRRGRAAARLRQGELEKLAFFDALTGLCNRRLFDLILEREVAKANRFRRPLSIVLMDVDRFKQQNDRFGHPAGDLMLRQIGRVLEQHTRSSDCAARIGGDEFAMVLGDSDVSGARVYASRVRASLVESSPVPEQPDIRCSVSIGISSFGVESSTPEKLIEQADRALYRAKALGRGRTEIESW